MPASTAAPVRDRAHAKREGLRCRVRLADGRFLRAARPGAPSRAAAGRGARADRRTGRARRRRPARRAASDHHPPARRPFPARRPGGGGEWLRRAARARRMPRRPRRGGVRRARRPGGGARRQARGHASRFLWVDVDQPGQLHALWAFLAERPCHLLVESGGSGGVHAYWRLAEPLPATRVIEATGELVEPIERAHLRLIHHLGTGADGKPNVADPACAERSRVMRLAGSDQRQDRRARADPRGRPRAARLPDQAARRRPARSRRRRSRPAPAVLVTARTRTSGSARRSTSRSSPAWSSRATGSCAARQPATRTATRRARSGPTQPGVALPRRRLRARGRDLRPRLGAARRARGARSCAARRSSAPARTSSTCSASPHDRSIDNR